MLAVNQLALVLPSQQLHEPLRHPAQVVAHGKALHRCGVGDQRHVVPWPGDIEHVPVLGNGAADDHPRVAIDPGKDCVQRFTADIVEVHIDAVWRLTVEAVCDPLVLVVDDTIDVQRLLQPVTLLKSTGDTDDPCAEVARNLGARVIGIAGGLEKCNWLKQTLHVDGVIDYKNERVADGLDREAPDGIDMYFDNVGGEALDAVLARINRHARMVVCGAISQYGDMFDITGPRNYMALITHSATMQGFTMRDYLRRVPEGFMQLLTWKHEGKLVYREHIVDGLEQFPDAFEMLFGGENNGKLLIRVLPC